MNHQELRVRLRRTSDKTGAGIGRENEASASDDYKKGTESPKVSRKLEQAARWRVFV